VAQEELLAWGGGQRIDLSIGLKTIEVIEREKLLKNAEKMGNYIKKRLRELQKKYPKIVDVRGLGLMIAFELDKEKYKHIFEKEAFKKGLMLLGCGEKSIRIVPPLIINRDEADEGIEVIEDVLKSLKK